MKSRRNVRHISGDALLTDITAKDRRKRTKIDTPENRDRCLNCKKPVSECKGDCR